MLDKQGGNAPGSTRIPSENMVPKGGSPSAAKPVTPTIGPIESSSPPLEGTSPVSGGGAIKSTAVPTLKAVALVVLGIGISYMRGKILKRETEILNKPNPTRQEIEEVEDYGRWRLEGFDLETRQPPWKYDPSWSEMLH